MPTVADVQRTWILCPSAYVAWKCTICLEQMNNGNGLPPDDHERTKRDLQQVQKLLKKRAPAGQSNRTQGEGAVRLLDEVICRLEPFVGLAEGILQEDLIRQLLGMRTAAEFVAQGKDEAVRYSQDGYYIQAKGEKKSSTETGSQPKVSHATRVGDALYTCFCCLEWPAILLQHVPMLEVAAGYEAEDDRLSRVFVNRMRGCLQLVVKVLQSKRPHELEDADFVTALEHAQRAFVKLTYLQQLDPEYPIRECRGALLTLIEDIGEARLNPTGTRLS